MTKQFDLSVLATPLYTVTLPSSGEEIKLRTLLTKEHKALLIAHESGNGIDAIEQVLKSCVVSDISIPDLSVGDAEYLFLQMYVNSVGNEQINAEYHCAAPKSKEEIQLLLEKRNEEVESVGDDDIFAEIMSQPDMSPEDALDDILSPDEMTCGTRIRCQIDLKHAFVPEFKGNDVVKVNDVVHIKLKHPSIKVWEKHDPKTAEGLFNLAAEAIYEVYVGDNVFTKRELIEQDKLIPIMEELDNISFTKVKTFIDDTPRLTAFVDVICPTCGNSEKVMLSGIEDFFV